MPVSGQRLLTVALSWVLRGSIVSMSRKWRSRMADEGGKRHVGWDLDFQIIQCPWFVESWQGVVTLGWPFEVFGVVRLYVACLV